MKTGKAMWHFNRCSPWRSAARHACPNLRSASCLGLALFLSVAVAAADEEDSYEISTGYERLSSSFHQLGHGLWGMAKLTLELEAELDPDLGGNEDDQDEVEVEPRGTLGLAWQPSNWFRVVTEVEIEKKFVLEPTGKEHGDFKVPLTRAYAVAENLLPGATLIAGRQSFEDEREWLWDQPLDGVRVIWRRNAFAFDIAAARDELLQRSLLERRDPEGGNYIWASGRYAFTDDVGGALYALYVDNREDRDDDLLFLGLQLQGELIDNVEHWLEAAVVTGEERGRDVLGFGFDTGATWHTKLPLDTAFTLGVAYGSGDDGNGDDSAFRQTGLQDNSGKFAGVASFKYYGQVLDPELSNLLILTAGAGIRPSRHSSIDLVYHHYRQVQKSEELRDAALEAEPNGDRTHLGDGIDLVLGWRATDRLSLKAAGGIFFPGPAFDADGPAYQASAKLSFQF
jgi:alginate production protein